MILKRERITYQLFYIATILMLLVSIFEEQLLVFIKPPVIIALIFIYIVNVKHINYLVLPTMLLIMVSEVLVLKDFKGYFKIINILLILYYCLNMVLLWKSIKKVRKQRKKIFTVQLVITILLIVYVLFSVSELILPKLNGNQSYLYILIACFTLFIGFCFYIYLNSMTVVSFSLMIAASCFLITTVLTALNKLYISMAVFTFLSNLVQMTGQFFLIKFFIEQDDLVSSNKDYL